MCKSIQSFEKKEKKNNKQVRPMIIGDWNEECIWRSNCVVNLACEHIPREISEP